MVAVVEAQDPGVVFDPFSAEFYRDPHTAYPRLRAEAPVYYNATHEFYALSRHADVAAGLKDFATYSSAYGVDLGMVRRGEKVPAKMLISIDPPEHRAMRSLVNKVFTPRAMEALRAMVSQTVERFLGAVQGREFDVVQDFSVYFPVDVITQMLGVPEKYRQQVRLWIDESLHREPGQIDMSESGMQAMAETWLMYYELIKQRREEPRDDMISALIAAEVTREDGTVDRLRDSEIAGFATLLGGAGAETVTKLVGSAAVTFAHHPGQWRRLCEDRGRIGVAIEELLRYDSPVQYNVRRSTRDVTLHGVTIPAGAPVFLLGASANRDPDAWTAPDVFDIDRDRAEAQNLGFGYGIHSCLGAALARLETSIALDKLLDFMPRYEVDWSGCRRVSMQNVSGWSHVPVRVLR
ncbi:cytochrome P450 [Mycolicibacterium vaccae]|jgi:cytochrome P450|uniref:Steroid C26-monooxygenase n=1 Tax=Mycolicibacterium vaccae ATCC 25954 TaxID=1194972 RepID=K0UT90_MYCVA|nr:cytochrome P450 [Mycolicibacterium vaccae]ANI39092.1 cytochrome P450 [Mycolicibacterium vaccae 95051]EJZ09961.1 cytochrome P450 [Mycolicibacterium vaccae ATCC 25954]MCV7063197.1 cytochrome P450 [Mycolicibacterium vaccae]